MTVSLAFGAVVGCRYVLPAADRLEAQIAERNAATGSTPDRVAPTATPLPIQVGPSNVTINRNDRFLVCQPDGRIESTKQEGFFARDTRFVSGWDLLVNGRRPVLLNSSPVQFFSARFAYVNGPLVDDVGPIAPHTIGDARRSHGPGRTARGPHAGQLRPPHRAAHDRGGDPVGLRRHLRGPRRRDRAARRDQHALVPLARASCARTTSTATSTASWSSRSPARTRRAQFANGRLVYIARIAAEARLARLPAVAADPRRRAGARRRCRARVSLAGHRAGRARWPQISLEAPAPDVVRDVGPGDPRHRRAAARGQRRGTWRGHSGSRRALVRDALRPRLADRLDADPHGPPGVRARRDAPPLATSRPPGTIPSATWSRARSRTRSATGSWRASGSCRSRRTTARTMRPASSSSRCRTSTTGLATTGSCPALPAQRRRGHELDRPPRRPDRDGFQEYRPARATATTTRAGRTPATRSATPTDRSRRCRSRWSSSRATPTRPSSGWPTLYDAGRPASGREAAAARRRRSCSTGSTRLLVGGRGHLLPGPRRREEADPVRGIERRAPLMSGIVPPERAGRVAARLLRRTCGRAGASGRSRPTTSATTRSATTRARSGRTTTRSSRGDSGATGSHAEAARVARGHRRRRRALRQANRLPELFAGLPRDETPSRSSTWAPTCRRRGPRAASSSSSRSWPGSTPAPTRGLTAARRPGAARLAAGSHDPRHPRRSRHRLAARDQRARRRAQQQQRLPGGVRARRAIDSAGWGAHAAVRRAQ